MLLDTGYTTGYLALDTQDVRSLGWSMIEGERAMRMARGGRSFLMYMKAEFYWMKGSTLSQL